MYLEEARKKLVMDIVALLFAVVTARFMPKRMCVSTNALRHGGLVRSERLL